MHYDALLKELCPKAKRLTELLAGSPLVSLLPTEFSEVRKRVPDLVGKLANGDTLHLELQSTNDAGMAARMLEYYSDLRKQYRRIQPRVLYVGREPLRMASSIEEEWLGFRFPLIDVRQFAAEDLIGSDSEADRLLALLCQGGAEREMVRRILHSVEPAEERHLENSAAKLLILSDLRRAKALVREEVRRMPITLKPEKGSFLYEVLEEGRLAGLQEGIELGIKDGVERGIALGEARLIQRLLESRFGALPGWALSRLHSASELDLSKWGMVVMNAETLEDFFGQ